MFVVQRHKDSGVRVMDGVWTRVKVTGQDYTSAGYMDGVWARVKVRLRPRLMLRLRDMGAVAGFVL